MIGTWTRLGAEFLTDPALLGVPRGARLLHVEALVWSNQQGTDGEIPSYMISRITDEPNPADTASELVSAGLWADGGDGWTILNFTEDQRSAADVRKSREMTNQRQRKRRQHNSGDHSLCEPKAYCRVTRDNPRDVTQESPVSHAVSHDTRTEPLRTAPSRKSEGAVTVVVATPGPSDPGVDRGNPARPEGWPAWCKSPSCDPLTSRLEIGDNRTPGGPCPDCSPPKRLKAAERKSA